MKHLEKELRNALRPKEAPPGFVEHVSSRISTDPLQNENHRKQWSLFFRLPKLAWLAAGVIACLTVILGITQYRNYQRTRAEGQLAKTQLMLALKIARKKLTFAQKKVLDMQNRGASAQRDRDQ